MNLVIEKGSIGASGAIPPNLMVKMGSLRTILLLQISIGLKILCYRMKRENLICISF
jgi:hypothetical protein